MALKTPNCLIKVVREDGTVAEYKVKDDKSWSIFNESILEIKEIGGSTHYFPLTSLKEWEVSGG